MTVQRGQKYMLSLAFVQPETGSRNYAKRLLLRGVQTFDNLYRKQQNCPCLRN